MSQWKLWCSTLQVLKQNIVLDIEEHYFTDVEDGPNNQVTFLIMAPHTVPLTGLDAQKLFISRLGWDGKEISEHSSWEHCFVVLIDKNYHSDAGVLVDFDDDLKKENFMRSLFCDVVKFFAGHKKGTGILGKKIQWSSPPLPFFRQRG